MKFQRMWRRVIKAVKAAIGQGCTKTEYKQAVGNDSENGNFEYAAFVWNKKRKEYELVSRPVASELLCRNRFEERVRNGMFDERYDISKVVFKKRIVILFLGQWKDIKED